MCKCTRTVVDQGQSVCVDCGRVGQRELCTSHTTFEQRFGTLRSSSYTREKRFNNKILGALQGNLLHRVNTNLVRYLKQCEREGRLETPEELLQCMSCYCVPRKPYLHAIAYWETIKRCKVIRLTPQEESVVRYWFREIFFATHRLSLPTPHIPMATVLQFVLERILPHKIYLGRFTRVLRCAKRTARYKIQFEKCVAYVENAKVHKRENTNTDIENSTA